MPHLAIHGGTPTIQKTPPLSKMFIEYPFAKRFANYVGAQHALTTSSGTASLICALIGAQIGSGDEVITVSHTWYCTATAILQVGAIPIFVDIEPETFCMDYTKIEEKISAKTKAILAVSLYGHPANYTKIIEIARKYNLVVIDDACQSTGAKLNGQYLGNVADITAFSFSGKPLVSTGGGIITTNNQDYIERAMLGGEHPSYISTHTKNPDIWKFASTGGFGNHYRIDGKCMERAYEQLEKLDAMNDYRRINAQYLTNKLKNVRGIKTPIELEGAHHVYHMYTCLFDSSLFGITRDEFVDALCAEGVPTAAYISSVNFLKSPDGSSYAAGPLHLRPLFQELARYGKCGPFQFPSECQVDYSKGSLPMTEKIVDVEFNFHQRALGAPNTKNMMDAYVSAIEKVLYYSDEIIKNRNPHKKRNAAFLVAYESDS